ncbi:hypothetical protein EUTSA_v10016633mg [Eutrema salsugineum]|uniref:Cytochrome P450 n=1 Tax=Eutrema salsugineum TaxID=72664 RepID=V4M883_EUTSA|nr:hypothetical protein EUTSA_v10016633mg [Eutrema salsugineum]
MSLIVMCVIAFVVIAISKWWYRWSNPKSNGKDHRLLKPHGFYEISPFIKKRMLRYGPLFKTNIFGSNTVVATDPDVIFEIFRQENKSFVSSYPDGYRKVFGKGSLLVKHGDLHKRTKQITMQLLGSEGLKRNMIGDINHANRELLRSAASQGTFDAKDTLTSLLLGILIPKMLSKIQPETERNLMDNIKGFNFDWFRSFCALSPWKAFYKVIMARRAAMQVMNDIFSARKESGERHGDFLDTLLEDVIFDENSALQHIFTLLVVAKDATTLANCLIVKLIAQNPKVLAELKREHNAILQNRADKKAGVSWEEHKHNMNFTNMVINESLRLMNLSPIMFRKAVKDVEIQGYTIPEGWIVAVAPSVVHYDPKIYENPSEFNPWRWEGKDLVKGSKSFMVFGGGLRQCVGAEFARLQIAIFLHHLVTNYDFWVAQDWEVTRTPIPLFPKEIMINISQSHTN